MSLRLLMNNASFAAVLMLSECQAGVSAMPAAASSAGGRDMLQYCLFRKINARDIVV